MTAAEVVYSRNGPAVAPYTASTLFDMAQILLQRTITCMVNRGVTVPDRQIIYPSPVPADCEQLAVLLLGWAPLPPWSGLQNCQQWRWVGMFAVAITRGSPAIPRSGGKAPTADSMTASARIASDDAEVLLDLVRGIDEVNQDLTLETGAAVGAYQTTILHVQVPVFGGLE